MTTLAAIFRIDGGPVDPQHVRFLLEPAQQRELPAGSSQVYCRGPVGLGATPAVDALLTERECSLLSRGPVTVLLDGFLDDTTALLAYLPPADREMLRHASDIQIALAAYEHLGIDLARHLLGDYALIIWDSRRRCLYAVTDALGSRCLYYRAEGSEVIIASWLSQMAPEPRSLSQLNSGYLLDYLLWPSAGRMVTSSTPVRGVFRLRRGYYLMASATGVKETQYWSASAVPDVQLPSDTDYRDYFRSCMEASVVARLPRKGSVGFELSGGLDSSSVLTLASRIRAGNASQSGALLAYTLTFGPYTSLDETEFARVAAEAAGAEWRLCSAEELGLWCLSRNLAAPPADEPWMFSHQQSWLELPILAAQADGVQLMLTGQGGDNLFLRTSGLMASALTSGHLLTFFRCLQHRWRGGSWRNVLFDEFLRYLCPLPLYLRLRQVANCRGDSSVCIDVVPRPLVPPWVEARASRTANLRERTRALWTATGIHSVRDLMREVVICSAWHVFVDQYVGRSLGIERRHPFWDRRLVEFMLGCPDDQKKRGGWTKFLLRRSLIDVLPNRVLTRRSKVEFSPLLWAGLRQTWASLVCLLHSSICDELELLDAAILEHFLTLRRQGWSGWWGYLESAVGLEIWLREWLSDGRRQDMGRVDQDVLACP